MFKLLLTVLFIITSNDNNNSRTVLRIVKFVYLVHIIINLLLTSNLTNDEEWKQFIVQVVKDYRKYFSDIKNRQHPSC